MPDPVRPQSAPAKTFASPWREPPPPELVPHLSLSVVPPDFFFSEAALCPRAKPGPQLQVPSIAKPWMPPMSQIVVAPAVRFSLSDVGAVVRPGDPLTNPVVAQAQQFLPKMLDLGPLTFGKFGGDVSGFSVGPVFGGVFTPNGIRLSAGLFANIPGLGSGIAAWRF